jgi:S-(hydroxymethyl)glutathione dehydrogenase/alcohol dehydrogenase
MNLNKIQFKAAVLFKQKTPLEIISISSNNLKRGQIFIKLFYSGICGSQLGEIMGVKGDDKYLPHLLGHEGVGEVIRTGDGVKKVKKGDIVLMHWMNSEGIESANPSYKYKKLKINAGNLTTFNEFAVVSENKVTKINKNSNYKKKLLLGCTASTAIGSLCKLTTLKKNDAIAVSGCGSIGMMILMICKELKIKNLLAIDISKEKLNFIKKRLKINTVNSKIIDIIKYVEKNFENKIDKFFECSGNTKMISDAFECLNKSGKEILIGVPKFKEKASFYTLDINLGKKLIGCKGGDFFPKSDIHIFDKLLNKIKDLEDNFFSDEIELDEINNIFDKMKNNRQIGKAIIKFRQ